MSRVGKKPVKIEDKVKIEMGETEIKVKGPLGEQTIKYNPTLTKVEVQGEEAVVGCKSDEKEARQAHGLIRALIQNAVTGVSKGFTKALQIEGVGYRAEAKGQTLNLVLGFSHPVNFEVPKAVQVQVEKQTKIVLTGSDKALVGQVAADIRAYRPPEPYKGKGVRYEDEVIMRKAGKSASK